MMAAWKGKSGDGFTMIEILVVLAIIVILLAVVIAVAKSLKESASLKRTYQTMDMLMSVAQEYEHEAGGLNLSEETAANPHYGDAAHPVSHLPKTFVNKVMELPRCREALRNFAGGNAFLIDNWGDPQVIDGFGSPLLFRTTGGPGGPAYYFQSMGPDRLANTNDDLFSYDPH